MEKAFKYLCIFMSLIIFISSLLMTLNVLNTERTEKDFLACKEIVENIKNYELNMTSIIYVQDSNGEWVEYQRIHGDENRIWVDIENIPQTLIDAFISIEDQRFYEHNGVDWKRTSGAIFNYLPYVSIYSSNQGGSTITQQLIKNLTEDNDESAGRKVREIARALLIEKMIDKTTILEAYLNTISLGNGICGVQVAANYYFNKDVKDLSLAECASLAAITKNPSAYNPQTNPDGNKNRRDDVLFKMYELDKITKEQYVAGIKEEVSVDRTQQHNFEIPVNDYFVDALIDEIIDDFATKYNCSINTASTMLYNGGYRIYATLDTDIQNAMEEVYLNQAKYFSQTSRTDRITNVQSAMTIMDYEGHIKGIVGGVGEKTVNRGLNRATDSPRQPGSTMKPLGVYVQAIENGNTFYSSVFEDKPMENYFSNGKSGPNEWYGSFDGYLTVAKALERSANTIPCWILRDIVGVENSYNFLTKKFHFSHLTSNDKNLSSLALGGCEYGITTTESAAAYAVFGNGGTYYSPTTYTKVIDRDGNVILQSGGGERIIKETTATIMNKLLQNVVYGSAGTGGTIARYSNMKVYAKTGTSSESKDLWMVAGTPYYIGSVWYGFDQPENIYDQAAAARVWRDVMIAVHKDLEYKEFEFSEDVIALRYCADSGLLPGDSCENIVIGYFDKNIDVAYCNGVHPVPEYVDPNAEQAPPEETPDDTESEIETPSDDTSSDIPPEEDSSSEDDTTSDSSDDNTASDDTSSDDTSSDDTNHETSSGDSSDVSSNEQTTAEY